MSHKNQPPYFKTQSQIYRAERHTQLSIGPIPSADELAKYESVKPGITDIILGEYQKQVNHRIEIENSVINHKSKLAERGQLYAFIIAMTVIVFGFILIIMKRNVYGIVSILAALVALVGVFVYGRYQEKQERIEKAKQVPEVK